MPKLNILGASTDNRYLWLKLGIRQKVIMILLLMLVLTLSISGFLAIEYQRRDILQRLESRGNGIAKYVAKSLAFSVVGYDYHTIQLLLDGIAGNDEVVYARVVDAKGKELGVSGARLPKDEMLSFIESITINQQHIGNLELGLGTAPALTALDAQKFDLLKWEALIILIVALGEFMALSFIIIRPVKRISSTIRKFTGEGACRLPEIDLDSNDEFGVMARQFNSLSRCLEDTHDKLRSRIALADEELVSKNKQLIKQSAELERINSELRQLTITDQLTGLFNRRHFDEHFKKEVAFSRRYNQPLSLLLIDLDRFKQVNDEYGHVIGDEVLRNISAMLLARVRQSDVLCRVGGEEFAILCKKTARSQALSLGTELLRPDQGYRMSIGELEFFVTLSIGISTLPDPQRQSGSMELFSCADRALYWAKEHGRNQVRHCQDLKEEGATDVSKMA